VAICPRCNQEVGVVAQFKFGSVWQHEYRLGEELRWGGNDVGTPGIHHAVVDGVAETECPSCGHDDEWNLYVHVESDRLVKVETATGEHDFLWLKRNYAVLRE
jgi:hypothetical protein